MTAHLVWSGKSQANINMKGVEEVNDGCIAIDADGAIVTSSVSHPQAQKRENVSTAGWVQKTAREQTHEADLAPSSSLFFIAFHFSRTHTHTHVRRAIDTVWWWSGTRDGRATQKRKMRSSVSHQPSHLVDSRQTHGEHKKKKKKTKEPRKEEKKWRRKKKKKN